MPSRSRRSSSATACCRSRPAPGARCGVCAAAGFTLLEVLVALAILGIGLGVVFQAIGQGLRLRGEAAENVRLSLVAESVLGRLPEREAAPAEPEEGEEAGCRWRIESVGAPAGGAAAAAPGAAPEPSGASLEEVRITVTAPSGRSWELYSLLPGPAEAAR